MRKYITNKDINILGDNCKEGFEGIHASFLKGFKLLSFFVFFAFFYFMLYFLGRGSSLRVARPAVPLPKPLPPRARRAAAVAAQLRFAYLKDLAVEEYKKGTGGRFV